ncbi:MAG: tRNA (N(6)-L-threonylcarbamoyladenosine(37)-C(2))-methylthiotransferase MtaB [Candidatus Cloacimonetes bacterium]|nr:tRNA (N(6)-L-threonylcarbamoyladenosine(37)-C(2))-methylthiotransferase MtaB [Candidatus Cloacimonadota bacterium]MCF7884029.1 tRNA (N(6)-L-threonylcarbamoyladenosine(37)-C(2))-methylthiotransferase MtaB [Candidatus Cloacimonadota bacterium]
MKTIAAITFGCKVNQYETSCILDEFAQHGYKIVDFNKPADIYIINSCTVTNRTDYKSRNALRKALQQKEINPGTKVVITGCYSQRNSDEILKIGDVDLIVDNNEKSKIYELIEYDKNLPGFGNLERLNIFDELSTTQMIDHSRAFIKVQDGCDYYCAYCAVAYARGPSRSRDKDKVIDQITILTEKGYREFVLGGINLGLFGHEKNDNYFLADLLKDIEKINKVKLIRLSSLEPQLFSDDLLNYFKESKKICPHFHIPLQVGCDELLQKMGRKYTTAEFLQTIHKLKQIFPNCAIGIDVIAGLPGETDELFQKTYDYLKSLDFTYLHVFSYSRRPGTRAAEMKEQVNGKFINKRSNILTQLSQQKTENYISKSLNSKTELRGVIEQKKDGFWTALSDHFIRIYISSEKDLEKKYLHFIPIKKRLNGIEVERINVKAESEKN